MTITLYFQGFSFSIMACDNNYYVCKQTPNTILDEKCVEKEFDFSLAHSSETSYYTTHFQRCKNYFYMKNLIPIGKSRQYLWFMLLYDSFMYFKFTSWVANRLGNTSSGNAYY